MRFAIHAVESFGNVEDEIRLRLTQSLWEFRRRFEANDFTIRSEGAGDRVDRLRGIPLSVEIIGRGRGAVGGISRRRFSEPGRVVPARTGRVLFRTRCIALVHRERRGLFRLLIIRETDARHPISFDRPRRGVAALVCRALRALICTRCWSTLRRSIAQERCHVRVGRKIQTEKISRNEFFSEFRI